MTTEITRDQAHALAAFVAALRAGSAQPWDEPGILAALRNACDKGTAAEIAIAAIRAADDPANRTPAVIAMDGKHWRAPEPQQEAAQATPRYVPPKREEACPVHPGQWRESCGGCRVEQYGDDVPVTGPADAATVRAEFAATRRLRQEREARRQEAGQS